MTATVEEQQHEEGFTLVELLVYMGLLVVVVTLVGAFLINSLNAQHTVDNVASAANESQLVARSLKAGLSNATAAQVSDGGTKLTARILPATGDASTNRQCQVWQVSGGKLFTKTSPTKITGTPGSGWTLLAEGAAAIAGSSAPIFKGTPNDTAKASMSTVAISFQATRGDDRPVVISTSITLRNPGDASTCF